MFDQTAVSIDRSAATGNAALAQPVFYKTLWSYSNDTPGDYSLVVVYTLSAP